MLQRRSVVLEEYGHARHDDYTDAIDEKIRGIISKNKDKPNLALKEIDSFVKKVKLQLKEEVIQGTKNVNDVLYF